MIPTQKLLYKLDMRLNKKVSNENQGIPLEDKILALNEAQIQLIKKKVGTNNIYGLGLDSFKKRYEDLQKLIVPFEPLSTTKTNEIYDSYSVELGELKYNFMFPLDMYTICSRGECKGRPVYMSKLIKHGDLSTLMFNTHYTPSFEYQESFALISSNKLIAYTDGTFKIDELHLSYLRYPKKIDSEGYIDFDGKPSINQDSELPDYLENELLDLAVLELAMDTDNTPVIQYSDIRNKNNE